MSFISNIKACLCNNAAYKIELKYRKTNHMNYWRGCWTLVLTCDQIALERGRGLFYSRFSDSWERIVGSLLRNWVAFLLTRRTKRSWKIRLKLSPWSSPFCLAFVTASFTCSIAPFHQPKVSTGIGRNTMPSCLHVSPAPLIFQL